MGGLLERNVQKHGQQWIAALAQAVEFFDEIKQREQRKQRQQQQKGGPEDFLCEVAKQDGHVGGRRLELAANAASSDILTTQAAFIAGESIQRQIVANIYRNIAFNRSVNTCASSAPLPLAIASR